MSLYKYLIQIYNKQLTHARHSLLIAPRVCFHWWHDILHIIAQIEVSAEKAKCSDLPARCFTSVSRGKIVIPHGPIRQGALAE